MYGVEGSVGERAKSTLLCVMRYIRNWNTNKVGLFESSASATHVIKLNHTYKTCNRMHTQSGLLLLQINVSYHTKLTWVILIARKLYIYTYIRVYMFFLTSSEILT